MTINYLYKLNSTELKSVQTVFTTLSKPFCPNHFIRIPFLSIPFYPLPFCPVTHWNASKRNRTETEWDTPETKKWPPIRVKHPPVTLVAGHLSLSPYLGHCGLSVACIGHPHHTDESQDRNHCLHLGESPSMNHVQVHKHYHHHHHQHHHYYSHYCIYQRKQ